MELSDADLYTSRGLADPGMGDLHATFLTNDDAGRAPGSDARERNSIVYEIDSNLRKGSSSRQYGTRVEVKHETKSADWDPGFSGLEHTGSVHGYRTTSAARGKEDTFASREEHRELLECEDAADDDVDAVVSVTSSPQATKIRLHRSGSIDISVDSEDFGAERMSEVDMGSLPSFPGSRRPRAPSHIAASEASAPMHYDEEDYSSSAYRRVGYGSRASPLFSTAGYPRPSSPRRASMSSMSTAGTLSAWERAKQMDHPAPRSAAVISAMGALQDKIRSLEKQVEQERERNLGLRADGESTRQSYTAQVQRLQAESQELASKVRAAEEAKRKACHHAEEYRTKLAEANAAHEEAQSEILALRQSCAEAQEKVSQKIAEHERLRQEADRAAEDIKAQIELRESRIKSLQEELVSTDTQKIESQAAIRNLLVLNEDLMNKLANATSTTSTTTKAKTKTAKKKLKKRAGDGTKAGGLAAGRKASATTMRTKTSAQAGTKKKTKKAPSGRTSGALSPQPRTPESTRVSRPKVNLRVKIDPRMSAQARARRQEVSERARQARADASMRRSRGRSLDKELAHANGDQPVPFLLGQNAGPSFSVYGRVQEGLSDPWAYGIPSPRERRARRTSVGRSSETFLVGEHESEKSSESEDDGGDDDDEDNDDAREEREYASESESAPETATSEKSTSVGGCQGGVSDSERGRRAPRDTGSHVILSSPQKAALAHARGLQLASPRGSTQLLSEPAMKRASGLGALEMSLRAELGCLQARYESLVTQLSGDDASSQASLRKSRELTELVEKVEIKTQQLAALEEAMGAELERPRSPVRSPEAFGRKVQALRTLQHFRLERPFL